MRTPFSDILTPTIEGNWTPQLLPHSLAFLLRKRLSPSTPGRLMVSVPHKEPSAQELSSLANQRQTAVSSPQSLQSSYRIFLSQASFYYYYYSCLGSAGEIFICIKTYIRRKKKRQTRVCPTKGLFEPSTRPLTSSLLRSPQRWNLGSRLKRSGS